MNEEYVITRIMYMFNVNYNFAYSIYHDLENRGLLNCFILNIDDFIDYEDFIRRYYYG